MHEYKVEGEIGLPSVNTEKTQLWKKGKKKVFICINLGQWVTFIGFVRQNGA